MLADAKWISLASRPSRLIPKGGCHTVHGSMSSTKAVMEEIEASYQGLPTHWRRLSRSWLAITNDPALAGPQVASPALAIRNRVEDAHADQIGIHGTEKGSSADPAVPSVRAKVLSDAS